MKVCLYCHKEFENKSELAKFCSDSHRVMFNQNKKKKVHKIAIGKISDLTIQIEKLVNMVDILKSKVSVQDVNQPTHFGIPNNENVVVSYETDKESQYHAYINEIRECKNLDQIKKIMGFVKADQLLTAQQKVRIEVAASDTSLDFYTD